MAIDSRRRSLAFLVHGALPPHGTNVLWMDSSVPDKPVLKIFWNGAWIPVHYVKGEIGIKTEIVKTLPATGEPDTLYLVPSDDPKLQDKYIEYLWVNDGESEGWEKVGGDQEIPETGHIYDAEKDSLVEGIDSTKGPLNIASGIRSHAEGVNTKASGHYSHAEGYETQANGNCSHVEGYKTFTVDEYAHAEGVRTGAIKSCSHAEGDGHLLQISGITISGNANATTYSINGTLGDGLTGLNIGDIIRVKQSYSGYKNPIARIVSIPTADSFTVDASLSSEALSGAKIEKLLGVAYNTASHSEGDRTVAVDEGSHSEGYFTKANGKSSHAEGDFTTAFGLSTHAEGSHTYAKGIESHAEGCNTWAYGNYSHAEGHGSKSSTSITVSGAANATTYVIESENTEVPIGSNILLVGTDTIVSVIDTPTSYSFVTDKTLSTSALNNAKIKIIYGVAYDESSHVEGDQCNAIGKYSHAEGNHTKAKNDAEHAEGKYNKSNAYTNLPEELVDLGLPSGTLWANKNLGANSPEDPGDYYSWGELEPKSNFTWDTYNSAFVVRYGSGTNIKFTKYCNYADEGYEGYTDTIPNLESEDDAATHLLGSEWHIPTLENWNELLENTTITTDTINGETVFVFTSNINSNYIIFPKSGWKSGTSIESGDAVHILLSRRTPKEETQYNGMATCVGCVSNEQQEIITHQLNTAWRFGHTIRAVRTGEKSLKTIHSIGIGTAENNRKNAVEVMQNGDVYVQGVGNYDGTNPINASTLQSVLKANKNVPYRAGANIDISSNIISAKGYTYDTTKDAFAEGTTTVATNNYEHAEGKYNKSNTGTVSSVGIGTADNARANAFEIMQNGDMYVYGVGNYLGTDIKAVDNNVETLQDVITGITSDLVTIINSI